MGRLFQALRARARWLGALIHRGGFYIALSVCLMMVGGAAFYARNFNRIPTPARVTGTPAPVAQSPESVQRLSDVLSATPAPTPIWPLSGRTILTKHSESIPQWSDTMGAYALHTGIDIQAAPGEAVIASISGTVSACYRDELLGLTVEIDGSGGYTARYDNLASLTVVAPGERVNAGQPIGSVGSTALSETALPAHLHYELYLNGIWAIPEAVLKSEE